VVRQVESFKHLKSLDLVVIYTLCLLGVFYSLFMAEAPIRNATKSDLTDKLIQNANIPRPSCK
jgi:hypothetical protein